MSDPFFPQRQRRQYATRTGGEKHERKQRLPVEMWEALKSEAAYRGVSAAAYEQEAIRRFIEDTVAHRVEGLRPFPARITDQGMSLMIAAANRARQPLSALAEHALLLVAATLEAPAETSTEKEAA